MDRGDHFRAVIGRHDRRVEDRGRLRLPRRDWLRIHVRVQVIQLPLILTFACTLLRLLDWDVHHQLRPVLHDLLPLDQLFCGHRPLKVIYFAEWIAKSSTLPETTSSPKSSRPDTYNKDDLCTVLVTEEFNCVK